MRSFFKTFFAALLALAVFTFALFIAIAGLIASGKKEPVTGEKAVLVIDLKTHFPEVHQTGDILSGMSLSAKPDPNLYDLIRIIHHAKNNDNVRGIYIKCAGNDNDLASSAEIRNALIDFRESNKFVFAYADVIPQRAYYVVSAADKVYCAPSGGVDWHGFAMTVPFIKGTLEKLDIEPQIFFAGKFKSATEPFRATEMTEPNRIQTTELLKDAYGQFLSDISRTRKIDTATLHRYADSNSVSFASQALQKKMVDGLKFDDEVKDEIKSLLKIGKDDKINFVSIAKYAEAEDYELSGNNKIALIYAEGNILDGTGDRDRIGGETYRNYIRRARTDNTIKAIVIRINSGGGSAAASEQMWREVDLATKEKPVIVSFGDVAASGGYYMACAADAIYAQPNTITGSIGVFGVLPNMEGFFNNKLGVTFDGVTTSPDADMMSVIKPLSPTQKRYYQSSIDTIYQRFLSHVSKGRNLSVAAVDSIAQGRVWSGSRALEIGLVDKLGGIEDAIAAAAEKAKIKDYRMRIYPDKPTLLERFFNNNEESKKEVMIREELGNDVYKTYSTIKGMKQMMRSAQAKMPFQIIIE